MTPISPTRRTWLGLASTLALGAPRLGQAQNDYPNRPVRILIPFPPGGGGDVSVRMIAKPLSDALGVPVLVDNKPGGDGTIAASDLMRSPPDGYSLLFGTPTSLLYAPLINASKPPYDPLKDFEAVSAFTSFTYFMFVNDSVPVDTIEGFIEYVRKNPGKVAYGTGDSTSTIAMAQFQMYGKLDMTHVPYKGSGQAVVDFAGGRLQVIVGSLDLVGTLQGKARPLVVLLPRRSALRPQIPTFGEVGLPQVNLLPWTGFFAPARTPRPILDKLSTEMTRTFKRPDLQEFFTNRGSILQGSSPEDLKQLVASQLPAWREAIRFAKIPTQ